jgi:hypothetical protein
MLDALHTIGSTVLDWSNQIAGALAVLTFLAQIWLLLRLRTLRRIVLRMGRGGQLARQVETHASNIAKLLQNFDANKADIRALRRDEWN